MSEIRRLPRKSDLFTRVILQEAARANGVGVPGIAAMLNQGVPFERIPDVVDLRNNHTYSSNTTNRVKPPEVVTHVSMGRLYRLLGGDLEAMDTVLTEAQLRRGRMRDPETWVRLDQVVVEMIDEESIRIKDGRVYPSEYDTDNN